MESVKYILGLPEKVTEIDIYPVTMRNYDEFMQVANILTFSYASFGIDKVDENTPSLLELIIFDDKDNIPLIIAFLEKVFTFVCRQTVSFDYEHPENLYFLVGEEEIFVINKENYDEIRRMILKQNLIFEPKIYKDKMVQEIANKVLVARAKNSLKCSIEDMITTVAIYGKSYDELAGYTIYQLRAEFNRILKLEEYRRLTLFQTVDTSGTLHPEHFAEEMDMFKSPYDDVFKEKTAFKNVNNLGI